MGQKRPWTRRRFLKALGGAALGVCARAVGDASPGAARAGRPHIVLLFVDDMGYSDIGCFGGEIDTPNLDRLAGAGVRVAQFYNTSRCCPARASLLTGLYSHQAGIGHMVYRDRGEGYRGNLNARCVTFGEVLRQAGYQTMLVGKWHAGHEPHSRPEVRGFDRFTGIYSHIDSYWKVLKACDVYRDRKLLIPAGQTPKNPYRPEEEFYTTDFFTDVATDYVDQALKNRAQPFLLHVCYNVPHFPLEAPDALIEKYRGRYLAGWDKLREAKLSRMKKLGIVPASSKLPRVKGFTNRKIPGFTGVGVETEPLPTWDSLAEPDRKELDFRRAIYAAQIERFDWNVGRLVEHLRRRGVLDNTLVLFFSDNGCSGEMGNFGMNWGKWTGANYAQWRKKGGWSVSQGLCWASYSNAPLRKHKKFVHEGGIASPFIAHWPAGIAGGGRILHDQVFHLIDVMPTLCELAGASYPREYGGRKITPAQGISMLPFLTRTNEPARVRTLFWQHENHAAIREGDWKLVTTNDRDDNAWELYYLAEDRSESDNLVKKYPNLAKRLRVLWGQWAERANVLPFPEQRSGSKGVPWPPRPWPED